MMPTFLTDRSLRNFTVTPVLQGEYRVSNDPEVVFSTILGSCVSVSLFDPVAKVGGTNHYLLPEGGKENRNNVKYGAFVIERLINNLLKLGASRARLTAKLCGGASVVAGLGDIGARNAQFARDFMNREGFRVSAEDLGGTHARKLHFHPCTGEAKVFLIPSDQATGIAAREKAPTTAIQSDVTIF